MKEATILDGKKYSSNMIKRISESISQIKFKIPTFKKNNLPDDIKSTPPIKPGSRKLSK